MVKVPRLPEPVHPPYYDVLLSSDVSAFMLTVLDDADAATARATLGVPALVGTTTDNAIARYDGTAGQFQNSAATVDDTGGITSPTFVQTGSGTAADPALQVGAADMGLFRQTSVRLGVSVSDTQCLSITSTSVEFQTGVKATLLTNFTTASGNAAIQSETQSTNTRVHHDFRNPNGIVGSITTNASATAYNTSSDERLKEAFEDFDAGQIIDAIGIYRYQWKVDGTLGYGPKAQELYQIFPQAVNVGSENDMPGDEGFAPWGYDASKLVPIMLKEMQSLRARNADLESRITRIEASLAL